MSQERQDHPEYQYLDLLKEIKDRGDETASMSTKVELKSVFGRQHHWDLSEGFPLLTTKRVFMKGIVHELLWFLKGDSNIKYLVDNDVHIWDEWAFKRYKKIGVKKGEPNMEADEFVARVKEDEDFASTWGELGPVYGSQWRRWHTSDNRVIDQLAWSMEKVRKEPSRKHNIVLAWNPEFIYEMAASEDTEMELPPCHLMYQVRIAGDKLSLGMYQRSCDMFLGVPFNIASYAMLTMMYAQAGGYQPGEFVHTLGDAHIYANHFDAVDLQLTHDPRPLPTLVLNRDIRDIDRFSYEDIKLLNYNSHPRIQADIVVVGGRIHSEETTSALLSDDEP